MPNIITMQRTSKRYKSESTADTMQSEDLTLSSAKSQSFDTSFFNENELKCLEKLRTGCLEENRDVSHELIIRYAIHYKFNFKKAKAAISKGYTERYLYLQMEGELVRYFMTSMVCFPLPGLKSRMTGSDVLYFRPSRFLPSSENNELLLDSMSYVLNSMSRNVDQCRKGIVMIVNMDGYSMKNFHNDTQMKMTRLAEGDIIPTRIVDILIVNPPKVSQLNASYHFQIFLSNSSFQTVLQKTLESYQTRILEELQEANPHDQE